MKINVAKKMELEEARKEELKKARKIIKSKTTKERENAFYTLYGVDSQKDVLEQFKTKVVALKVVPYTNKRMSKAKIELKVDAQYQEQYTKLLELILNYSNAIFFLYSRDRINKNLLEYRKIALKNIKKENVEKAFSNLARIYSYKEDTGESTTDTEEPTTDTEEPTMIIDNDCLALEHINTLKTELAKDIKVMGGSVEDKKAYMKYAIVSLATGATPKDMLDTAYNIDPKKSIFDYEYINNLVMELRAYQTERAKPLSERGIRNGVDKLNLSMSKKLHEKVDKKYSHCRNFNHLIHLHKECKTSSTPKSQN